MPQKYKDVSGQRFGKLVAIETTRLPNCGKLYWRCICDCGKESIVNAKDLIRKGRGTKSCGCSAGNIKPEGVAAVNYIFGQYKKDARYANRKFCLTKSLFKKLIKQNCYYCGSPPSNKFERKNRKWPPYFYSGIDRVDPTRGYHKDNCVSCCSRCNFAKHKMTKKVFLEHILKIVRHLNIYDSDLEKKQNGK